MRLDRHNSLLILLISLLIAALACGQAASTQGSAQSPTTIAAATGSAQPAPADSAGSEPALAGNPILIGTEYIIIEAPWRVAQLADLLEPLGLTAAKPLPENFAWGKMQSSPEADLDFTNLDNFVNQFQSQGIETLVLGLRSLNDWASKDVRVEGALFPLKGGIKEEYLDEYEAWVTAIVERYDGDGVSDLPGLKAPIRYYEVGVEFSSYEPEPVEEYLQILELSYRAAHAAYPDVLIAHVAFLATPALFETLAPSEYESAFALLEDQTHPLGDMRAVLDRPDLFDVLNIHSLGHPYEIEAIVAWLNYETGQRGYQKPVMISDTGSTPFIAWGPATICDRPQNQMGRLVLPATEADRCRLADYFTRLVGADIATLQWTREFIAKDTVKRVVVAAEQGVVLINTAFTEDLLLLKLGLAQAGAGTAAWAGLVDFDKKELRPVFYALQQLIAEMDSYTRISRVLFEDPGVRLYELEKEGQPAWIAWYDPGKLYLPDDSLPQTTLQFDFGAAKVTVSEIAIAAGGAVSQVIEAVDGVVSITLGYSPVFISIGG